MSSAAMVNREPRPGTASAPQPGRAPTPRAGSDGSSPQHSDSHNNSKAVAATSYAAHQNQPIKPLVIVAACVAALGGEFLDAAAAAAPTKNVS